MNVYVVSVAYKNEPLDPQIAFESLDAAKDAVSRKRNVELSRVSYNVWKATDGFDEWWCHRIELAERAS